MGLSEEMVRALTDPRLAVVVFSLCIAGLFAYFLTLYHYEKEKKEWQREKEKLVELLKKGKGFTLVELLTVLAIIAVLSAILLPFGRMLQDNVHKHACISNLQKIYHALRMYYLDTGTYPEYLAEIHSEDLERLIDAGMVGIPIANPAGAEAVIGRKGIYPIFASELHCPANIDHPKPIVEVNGSYYIDPLYFNYVVPDPFLQFPTYQRVRCKDGSNRPQGTTCRCRLGSVPAYPAYLGEAFPKQLYAKEPQSSTVITWCWAHNGKYIVLFYDGHTEVREASEMYIPAVNGGIAPWGIQPRRP